MHTFVHKINHEKLGLKTDQEPVPNHPRRMRNWTG